SNNPQIIVTPGTWYRDVKSGRIEATISSPTRKTPREDPKEIERRIVEQETEALRQRQKEVEQYSFNLPSDRAPPVYDYKSPFSEEYDQAIAFQSQLQGN
ncbi:unnamed protein product, partial [Rotaria magnacalcarata]